MKHLLGIMIFLSFLGLHETFAQSREVKGVVYEKTTHSPIPGVSVFIKGNTSHGSISDVNGAFSLKADAGDIILFTFIGMKTQEIPVANIKSDSPLKIYLEEAQEKLDEVVVIGYGTRKKGSITGTVSVVEAKKLETVPVASFDQALQGQAPGIQVLSNSGQPNASADIMIRGVNSINAGSAPLFIIDGMEVSSSVFSTIPASDIANVSILKDASSTAIFGARATNGVIIITTKSGRMGDQAKINVRAQWGISSLARDNWDLMNTKEKLDYEEEIGLHANDPNWKRSDWENVNVDWRDAVFNDNAFMQSYELSVSGGTSKSRYYISGNFHDQEGVAYKTSFQRYSVRANIETQANDWFKIGANTSLSYREAQGTEENEYYVNTPLGAVQYMNPYWDYRGRHEDGSWNGGNFENPLEYMDNNNKTSNAAKVLLSGFIQLTPLKDLNIKSQGGVDFTDQRTSVFANPDYIANKGEGVAGEAFYRDYRLLLTNTIDYQFNIGELHNIRLLAGQEANYYQGSNFGATAFGLTDKRLLEFGLGTSWKNGSSTKTETTFLSYFGRVEYNYNDKYFADVTYRRDGSSRFGKNSKFGNFWSIGLMWNFQKETFFDKIGWLTMGQTSLSVGTQGNSSISNYAHLTTVSAGASYNNVNGILPSIGNEDLTWEKTRTIDWGIKLGFLNRYHLNVNYYHKLTSDMLMQIPYSMTSGFAKGWGNAGEMTNAGVEVELNADIIQAKGFTWNVSVNFAHNKNEIKKLYHGEKEYTEANSGIKHVVGRPLGEFELVRWAGVNPLNGDALWYTKDGEITNVFSESDAVLTGKTYFAPWTGGFSTSLDYKGLTLSAQFSWVAKRYMYNNDRMLAESNGRDASTQQSKKLLYDRWKQPGDIAKIPRHGIAPQMDDRFLEDASFLRLKNVMLAYTLPMRWMKSTGFIGNARVFAQGQNLLTFTPFTGKDPESSLNMYRATYPLSKQYTFGLEITF